MEPTMDKKRVLLADDHPIIRMSVRKMLSSAPDIVVVGEAVDGEDTLRLVKELDPDVLVMDIEMPELDGREVARRLKQTQSRVKILVLSAYDNPEYVEGMMSLGASGYIVKNEAPDMIVDAVRGVARGEIGWTSKCVVSQMMVAMQQPSQAEILSPRESEVLRAVIDGKTNQEIAVHMFISEKTVEKHIVAIFRKLGVSSRVEAAVTAIRKGWV
jgi:DNA-binding NarL/FixJ family response regulator